MSTNKFIICLAIVLVIALVAANWDKVSAATTAGDSPIKKLADAVTGKKSTTSTSTGKTVTTAPAGLDPSRRMMSGSTGPEVVELQKQLNIIVPAAPLVTDGIFGPLTLSKLQAAAGVSTITLSEIYLTKSTLGF